jgi:hypothetical protein
MPAESNGPQYRATSGTQLQRLRAERRACNLDISIETPHGNAAAKVGNISAGGIGFTTFLRLRPGEQLQVSSPMIGRLTCVVRWAAHPRYGAEFTHSPQVGSTAFAFYDSLPPTSGEAP